MKKNLCVLFCITAAVLILFTGCHGSTSLAPFEMPEEFDTSKEYELVFWSKNDSNITQAEVYNKAAEEFEKLYPNIHITIKRYSDYKVIYNDVITNIPTQTTPDVCISYPDHIATYISGENVVVPLDVLMNDPKYGLGGSELRFDAPSEEEIFKKFLDEGKIGGVQYCLPYMRSTEATYINKTYVESMGFEIPDIPTWDWIYAVGEAAMKKNEDDTFVVNGQKIMIPVIYKSTDNMMITMVNQLGSGYSDDEGNISLFNDTTKQLLFQVAEHASTGSFSTFKISSYPGNFLNAGQCLIGIDSTAGATWMGSGAGHQDISSDQIKQFETVVRPVPQFDTENPKMISQGPSICLFNKKDPQEVLAAWLFAQFLLTNDIQISYSMTEGYVPVTSKAMMSDEYQDYLSRSGEDSDLYYHVKIDASKLLLENIDNSFITPVFRGSADLRDAAGDLIENAAYATRRKLTVDDAFIEKTYKDVIALHRIGSASQDETSGRKDLGELPTTAKVLLASLVLAWILIVVYNIGVVFKGRKTAKKGEEK